ncbi:hypothetical protein EDB80DRAFT_771917 [Ilyonectria destructans]|nr:hypothetical protein EDB80DRAFT_771917 [Ilyonectria destructans]
MARRARGVTLFHGGAFTGGMAREGGSDCYVVWFVVQSSSVPLAVVWSDPGSRPGHRCSALVPFKRIARGPSQREPRPCETKWEPPPIENKQVGHVAVGQTALREPTPLSRRLAAVSPRRTCEDDLAGLYSSLGSAGGGAEESNKGHGGRGASGPWTAWRWLLNVVFRTASSWFGLEFGLWIKSPTYTPS